MELRSEQE